MKEKLLPDGWTEAESDNEYVFTHDNDPQQVIAVVEEDGRYTVNCVYSCDHFDSIIHAETYAIGYMYRYNEVNVVDDDE